MKYKSSLAKQVKLFDEIVEENIWAKFLVIIWENVELFHSLLHPEHLSGMVCLKGEVKLY